MYINAYKNINQVSINKIKFEHKKDPLLLLLLLYF